MRDDDAQLQAHLLGDLSEEERQEIEDRAFLDEEFFENLEAAEDDLVDARVRGELSDREQHRFDQSLGRSHRIRERLILAQGLAWEADRSRLAPVVPIWRRSPAATFLAAALFLFAIGLPLQRWLTSPDGQSPGPVFEDSGPLAEVPSTASPREVVRFERVLQPLRQRGVGDEDDVLVWSEGGVLDLYLEIDEEFDALEVTAWDEQGSRLWRRPARSETFDWGVAVVLELESGEVPAGRTTFQLHLPGSDDVLATYRLQSARPPL